MPVPSFDDPRQQRIERFKFSKELQEKIENTDRCFILGLGPSLAKLNPDEMKDEFVIGVNYILKTNFRPDVICISDPSRVDASDLRPGCPKIVTVNHVYRRSPEIFDAVDTYHGIDFIDAGSKKRNVSNIDNIDYRLEKIYWAASVIAELAVPFAAYLGMKEIYVLGLDGARASFPSTHIWGQDQNLSGPHPSKLFHLHECMADLIKKVGSRVYNASFGGVVAAFPKVDMGKIKPQAVLTEMPGELDGKIIVYKARPLKIKKSDTGYRILDESNGKYLRHRNSRVDLHKDDGSEVFLSESTWNIEPSFVRRDWVSFRSVNVNDGYVVSEDGLGQYFLWTCADIFSPYFSSFRLFNSLEEALTRIETDKFLQSLENMKKLLGNMMMRNDKS